MKVTNANRKREFRLPEVQRFEKCEVALADAEAALLLYERVHPALLKPDQAALFHEKREEALKLRGPQHPFLAASAATPAPPPAQKESSSTHRFGAAIDGGGKASKNQSSAVALVKSSLASRRHEHDQVSQSRGGGGGFFGGLFGGGGGEPSDPLKSLEQPAEILNSMATDARAEGDRAEASALFLAAHVLRPHEHRYAISAANLLLEQGDIEAATALFGMLDEKHLSRDQAALVNRTTAHFRQLQGAQRHVIRLQASLRGFMVRRSMSRWLRDEHVVMMMLALESEQAVNVQRRWRARRDRQLREVETRATLRLQAAVRGFRSRKELPERKLRHLILTNAARRIQRHTRKRYARQVILTQCSGFIEKQARLAKLGPIELSVWQICWVYVTRDDLRYQKAGKADDLDKDDKVRYEIKHASRPKRIPFELVVEVRAQLDDCVLVIKQKRGNWGTRTITHRLLLSNEDEAELWAVNVLQLAVLAGAKCVGKLEGTNDDGFLEVVKLDSDVLHDERFNFKRRAKANEANETSALSANRGFRCAHGDPLVHTCSPLPARSTRSDPALFWPAIGFDLAPPPRATAVRWTTPSSRRISTRHRIGHVDSELDAAVELA